MHNQNSNLIPILVFFFFLSMFWSCFGMILVVGASNNNEIGNTSVVRNKSLSKQQFQPCFNASELKLNETISFVFKYSMQLNCDIINKKCFFIIKTDRIVFSYNLQFLNISHYIRVVK